MNFIQIKNIIDNVLLVYIVNYVPISMLLCAIFFTITLKTPPTKDMVEIIDDINKQVENVRRTNEHTANCLETLFETLLNNKLAMLVFLMLLFLIPYVRIVMFSSSISGYIDYKKKK